MKNKLSVTLALAVVMTACALPGSDKPAEHWFHNSRIVKLPMPRKVVPGELEKTLSKLKASGVNTILDHGSLQFLPGLPPHGKAQWTLPVNYKVAEPYSKAVKAAGMKLIHHTTSTFAPNEAMQKPEYQGMFSLDVNTGKTALRAPGQSYADAVFMDMNHPGFRSIIFRNMVEYAKRCGADGFQVDEVEFLPGIYASGSRDGSHKLFKEKYGKPMPQGEFDPDQPDWRRYMQFRYASGGDFHQALLRELRQANPDMIISGCLAGISKPWLRIRAQGSADWLRGWNVGFFEMEEAGHPRGKRGGFLASSYYPTYYREMALYNAYAEVYNWLGCFSIGYPSTWKVKNSEQFLLWAMNSLMGFRYEMRDYQAEEEWFAWEEKYEKMLIRPRRIANVGIVFPERERDYRSVSETAHRNWSGLSEALARECIITDQLVYKHFEKPELLRRFDLIVLPGDSFISPEMAAELKKFVANGGVLLAVGLSDTQDAFSAAPRANELLELFGVESYTAQNNGKATAAKIKKFLPGLENRVVVLSEPGFNLVKVRKNARVAAYGSKYPAVIVNNYGKGKCVFIPGNWGERLYSYAWQKGTKFNQTADFSQHKVLAAMVKSLLKNPPVVEVKNLPAKFMFNAYDTAGFSEKMRCRTIHVLDCFDGYEKGETIPPTNQPCRFKPLAERNGSQPVCFTVNNFAQLQKVVLLSPDRAEPLELGFKPADRPNSWQIDVPAKEFGRYTIIVCMPQK